MSEELILQLKQLIDDAEVVSFDVFDTLLLRKVNNPETIFDLVGKNFGIWNFRKLRMDEQINASNLVIKEYNYPHANYDEIYRCLSKHTEIVVDWDEVKAYELQIELDSLVANKDMTDIYNYAKSQNKRIVATTDMYLPADTISQFLEKCGFNGFSEVYCSADERKAKFDGSLFKLLIEREGVLPGKILHIGDNKKADYEIPSRYGITCFHYEWEGKNRPDALYSEIDAGMYRILYTPEKGFWYNLGVEVGGPLYMGLYLWLRERIENTNKKVFFIARDGYILYKLFKSAGYSNVEYLHTSRRALMMAGITQIDDDALGVLPPFTYGQTVGELLDYLCIPADKVGFLNKAGFDGVDDIIRNRDDMDRFKKLYHLNREMFLQYCQHEREKALEYFNKIGFFDDEAILFDCGWSGSSQYLIERFKKALNIQKNDTFYYFGIKDTRKSRKQLRGQLYDIFMGDFNSNHEFEQKITGNEVMYELFFSAPHGSVWIYGDEGPVFEKEDDINIDIKKQLTDGILNYVNIGAEFASKYNVDYSRNISIGSLERLIAYPTDDEAIIIGNISNVDGFAKHEGIEKKIAYVAEKDFDDNPAIEIYWLNGFLKRPDINENFKMKVARKRGVAYPKEKKEEYHLENIDDIYTYHRWIRHHRRSSQNELSFYPVFSVVMPVYNTKLDQLKEAIESVLRQTYDKFELILVDDHSTWENIVPFLKQYEEDPHTKIIYRTVNGNISVATNDGIVAAEGDYIAFMDCDDTIEPDALYEFAGMINENPELDFIYSDEDKITEDGLIRHIPFFKPNWSPDLFMSMMYTNHLAVYRTEIAKSIGGLRSAYNGAQDYDFTLRFLEKTTNFKVGHIPKILYHWRERRESISFSMSSKNYAMEAAKNAKQDALQRRGIKGYMEHIPGMNQHRAVYEPINEPLVSIIIPSKDNMDMLRQCILSISKYTDYTNYELIVVDNGSDGNNRSAIESFLSEHGTMYIYDSFPFNFSKMCNIGAQASNGQYLLFLNDDIEITSPEWLRRMLGQAQQEHTGAVGAKLYYPNSNIIQHTGVSVIKEGPSHDFLRVPDVGSSCFGLTLTDRNCTAVTGACLLVSKDIFSAVEGFDENLTIGYNDIDLCYKICEQGYYNVIRNDVICYHHESYSRGNDNADKGKQERLESERKKLYEKHPRYDGKDLFRNENLKIYSPCLTLEEAYPQIDIVTLEGAVINGEGVVEIKENRETVLIGGWSLIENESNQQSERYLIITDRYGLNYRIPLVKVPRPDLNEFLKSENEWLYSGFTCRIPKHKLKFNIRECQLGIMTIGTGDTRYYFIPHIIFLNNVSNNDKDLLAFCKKHKKVYIYGAGIYGKKCASILQQNNCRIEAFIVTRKDSEAAINGVEVKTLDEIDNVNDWNDVGIIVALKVLYRREVLPVLEGKGIKNIFTYPPNLK